MNQARREAAAGVLAALGHPDFRHRLREIAAVGTEHRVVVAVADETVQSAFDRLGGSERAVLAVVEGDHEIAIVVVEHVKSGPAERSADLPVGHEATVGMLLTYLREYPGTHTVRVQPCMTLELVDQGPGTGELLTT